MRLVVWQKPEDSNLHIRRRENLKSHMIFLVFHGLGSSQPI
jgi:hypothetical protein